MGQVLHVFDLNTQRKKYFFLSAILSGVYERELLECFETVVSRETYYTWHALHGKRPTLDFRIFSDRLSDHDWPMRSPSHCVVSSVLYMIIMSSKINPIPKLTQ